MDQIPNEFKCPISMELMTDPVLCEDGQTYDRRSIQEWLKQSQTSPLTRQPLNPNALRSNLALKASIERWKQSQNNKQHQVINPVSTYPYQYQPSYQIPPPPPPYVYPPPVTQSAYATTTIVPVQQQQIQTGTNTIDAERKKRALRIICLALGIILIIIILSSIISSRNNRTSRYADDDDN